jgi:alcohol dehydrogenase
MKFKPFAYARVPPLHFGCGKLSLLPELAAGFDARRVLLVTGGRSLAASGKLELLESVLREAGIDVDTVSCAGEPSASFVDDVCRKKRARQIDLVVGIGGGSAVDAGKAISAMLPHQNSIFDHLEGVGRGIPHSGVKTPYIAIPTSSGTGSEVTKNAVISEVGPAGYKKSIRHDHLIPDAVIVDGKLMTSCPPAVSAACGMDAFTQLLEPYLSPDVSPLTEALALSGFAAIRDSLLSACGSGAGDPAVREQMAYASLLSGITLANDGLGILHGLASPIGGYFPIPHGVVCATLVAASVRANLKALRQRAPRSTALTKMAQVGALLRGQSRGAEAADCDALLEVLDEWTVALEIPRLGCYGIGDAELDRILDKADNRNNPIALEREEIWALLEERL